MANPKLVTTSFDESSTTDDVLADVDLTGVRAVVTGASSGLGVETARALAAAGAKVTLAVRNVAAGRVAADEIKQLGAAHRPRVLALDLADRASISRFVECWEGPLHLLINNAGVVTGGLERTVEGWEMQFATSFLLPRPFRALERPPWRTGCRSDRPRRSADRLSQLHRAHAGRCLLR